MGRFNFGKVLKAAAKDGSLEKAVDKMEADLADGTPLTAASRFTAGAFSMPALGLGTYLMNDAEATSSCAQALTLGYAHIDTAEVYKNEVAVGAAIAAHPRTRDSIFVTTKLFPGNSLWGMPVKGGDAVAGNCAEQLAKLGLEYVDLYLIHAPFAFAESLACGVEQWRAMLALKEDGTCRAVGVSNYGVHHLEAIKAAGLELPCANQLEIHPLCQQKEIVAWCLANNVRFDFVFS